MQGSFHPDGAGTVLKVYNERERKCLEALSTDILRGYVPEFMGEVTTSEGKRIFFCHFYHPFNFHFRFRCICYLFYR